MNHCFFTSDDAVLNKTGQVLVLTCDGSFLRAVSGLCIVSKLEYGADSVEERDMIEILAVENVFMLRILDVVEVWMNSICAVYSMVPRIVFAESILESTTTCAPLLFALVR